MLQNDRFICAGTSAAGFEENSNSILTEMSGYYQVFGLFQQDAGLILLNE